MVSGGNWLIMSEEFIEFSEGALRKGLPQGDVEFLSEVELDFAVYCKLKLISHGEMGTKDEFVELRGWLNLCLFSDSYEETMKRVFESSEMEIKKGKSGRREVVSGEISIIPGASFVRAILMVFVMEGIKDGCS